MTMDRMLRNKDPERVRPVRSSQGLLSRHGLLRKALHYGGLVVLAAGALLIAGFLHFADSVTNLKPQNNPKADAIVVLTGGYQRIEQAIDLLRQGAGQRLLISGVNPSTTANQIRRVTQSSPDLFECCVDIGYDAIDTVGNANETSRWIREHGYRSILIVTSNYHMQRSLMELRRIDRDTEFIPYPVVNADLKTRAWYAEPDALRTMLSEYGKTVIAYLRGLLGLQLSEGLREKSG
ncbi:YdcF family protein [Peteryoungia desertarenae]|uniref:YdcF family protein n=1 Tax=Peteryoungia desertarenae TaxID=1813451 RepID=A0ABX6QRI8_9HYPH|nr:YdcF family protein [Peteryoungia desertarenae]